MIIVKEALEKRLKKVIAINDMQLGFMPGRGAIDAVFVLITIQEEYLAKQNKLYLCFVDLKKAFDRVLRKVMQWAMRKKGIPEALVRAVISLYEGQKTKF